MDAEQIKQLNAMSEALTEAIKDVAEQKLKTVQQEKEITDLRRQLALEKVVPEETMATPIQLPREEEMSMRVLADQRKIMASTFQRNMTHYDGERNASKIDTFLETFENYAKATGLSIENVMLIFGTFLRGKAHEWWDFFDKTKRPKIPAEDAEEQWAIVKRALKKEFTPVQHMASLQASLHSLDTRNGLMDYIVKMRKVIRQIGDCASEREIWNVLMYRIPADAEMHLRALKITTSTAALEELQVYAASYAEKNRDSRQAKRDKKDITKEKPTYRKYRPDTFSSTQPKLDSSHPNYMDVDAVKLREGYKPNNSQDSRRTKKDISRFENIEPTMANYNNFEALPLTDRLRRFLMEHKGCFYCRQLNANHGSQTCPKKKGKGSKN